MNLHGPRGNRRANRRRWGAPVAGRGHGHPLFGALAIMAMEIIQNIFIMCIYRYNLMDSSLYNYIVTYIYIFYIILSSLVFDRCIMDDSLTVWIWLIMVSITKEWLRYLRSWLFLAESSMLNLAMTMMLNTNYEGWFMIWNNLIPSGKLT